MTMPDAPTAARSREPTACEAWAVCARFDTDYEIRDSKYGKGLFVKRAFAQGEFIARYDGTVLNAASVPKGLPRSHMMRVPGSDHIVDGYKLAYWLLRQRGGTYQPLNPCHASRSYGALVNSADESHQVNARWRYLLDDSPDRRTGLAPDRAVMDLRPRVAFFEAKRALKPGEEVLAQYKWV